MNLLISVSWVYDSNASAKGFRILVDRLWPRGMSKDKLRLDRWEKEIAPSNDLRKWFSHDPEKWDEFRSRYFEELDKNPKTPEFLDLCKKGDVVFLYSAKNHEVNNAVALKEYVMRHLLK